MGRHLPFFLPGGTDMVAETEETDDESLVLTTGIGVGTAAISA